MAHEMNTRTTGATVVFRRPFTLSGLDGMQPAGAYRVDTHERLLDTVSSTAYLRISTSIELHAQQPGIMRSATIDPAELEAALAQDAILVALPNCQPIEPAAPGTITSVPAAPKFRRFWRWLSRNRGVAS